MFSASAEIGFCDEYHRPGEEERKVTIVIAPIHVRQESESAVIGWACSRGHRCAADCRYAKRRPEKEENP